jgi:hypothetical protein
MEEKEAPCKTPTMVEEVEITCEVSTKVGKGQQANKKNVVMKQHKILNIMINASSLSYGKMKCLMLVFFV